MVIFQKLFKRTKLKDIQQYGIKISQIENSPNWLITKETGRLDGKLIEHFETVTEGKQGRSIYEQAKFKAEAYIKEKLDEGYKKIDDVSVKYSGYHAGKPLYQYEPTLKYGSLYEMLELALPQFNTTSEGHAKPMLATAWEKIKKPIQYPVLLQPKLDGVRATIEIDLETLTCLTISRSGKYYDTMTHVTDEISRKLRDRVMLTSAIDAYSENGLLILDGEVYSDDISFQDIVSSVKKIDPSNSLLKFRMYDVIHPEIQEYRTQAVENIIEFFEIKNLQGVITRWVHNKEEVEYWHDVWVKMGYEGAMIRLPQGVYAKGQRSRELIKVKKFNETEFEFVLFVFGERPEDLIGVFKNKDKAVFRAKVMGNVAYKKELYKKYTSKSKVKATIKHFGYTDDGLPRFPVAKVFRDYE